MRWVRGDNAIVWSKARLDLSARGTSMKEHRNTITWSSWGTSEHCDRKDRGQIALRLWDRRLGRPVVAASIRWTYTTAFDCMIRNLAALNRRLETRWPRRRLTIVGGDFNSVADKRVRPGGGDLIGAGMEGDPECWYRVFSRLKRNHLQDSRSRRGGTDCTDARYFDRAADSYYDTVWLATRGRARALCDAWTYTRKLRARHGTSCTDTNDDELRDRSRIDFIWVRWEDRRGDALDLTRGEASERVGVAGPDRVCLDGPCLHPVYSDHRATHAAVR